MGAFSSKCNKKEDKKSETNDVPPTSLNVFKKSCIYETIEQNSSISTLPNKQIIPALTTNNNENCTDQSQKPKVVHQQTTPSSQQGSPCVNIPNNSQENQRTQLQLQEIKEHKKSLPTPEQKHVHDQNNNVLAETFKNIPKNLQNNQAYISVLQPGSLMCNLCKCEMTSGSLVGHLEGRKHLGRLPRAYLEAQIKRSRKRQSQSSLNKILGGSCVICNVKIPDNRMFVEHCKGRKHQNRLTN